MKTFLNSLFWIAIGLDGLLLLIIGLLAMAAAPNAKPGYARDMIPMFLIPAALLAGAIVAHTRSTSAVLRGVSLLLALFPSGCFLPW